MNSKFDLMMNTVVSLFAFTMMMVLILKLAHTLADVIVMILATITLVSLPWALSAGNKK